MDISPKTSDARSEADSGNQLESLFDGARGELLGTLFYVVGNMDDARESLQETFLKCWRSRDQIDSVDNLRAWVFRIALNTGRDCRKTAWNRRRQSMSEDFPMISMSDSPDRGLLAEEEQALLRRAVMDLRPEEKEVFLLRQNGTLTYEQIAQVTSLPLGTVKTRMRKAITQLRQAVGGQS